MSIQIIQISVKNLRGKLNANMVIRMNKAAYIVTLEVTKEKSSEEKLCCEDFN